tara:strand:+ start:127 stop:522 length:396 start_codon:yes stop_codon:yes gene_type:complete
MTKIKIDYLTPKWLKVKEVYENGTNGSNRYGTNFEVKGELDILTHELVNIIGDLTQEFGWDCVIEDVKMDLWKERIWSLIENAGLLPEIAWRDDLEAEQEDYNKWNPHDEEFEINEEELLDEDLIETENYD